MDNNLVPIALWQNVSDAPPVAVDTVFGKCTQCNHDLEEAEFAIGDICDGCRPAFMHAREASQEAEAEERAERLRYPEESEDCDCCGYGCRECD